MEISKKRLKQIIKEEILTITLSEGETLSEDAKSVLKGVELLNSSELLKIQAAIQSRLSLEK